MAEGTPRFLIVRPDDLVVLGVELSGFTGVAEGALELEAGDDAFLTLTFPPQHIVERAADPAPGDVWHPLGGRFPPGAPVSAVAVKGLGQVDALAVDDQGYLLHREGWARATWKRTLAEHMRRGTTVAAVSRVPSTVDVYAVDAAGALVWSRIAVFGPPEPFGDGYSGSAASQHWQVLGRGYGPSAPVTAVTRKPVDVDVFAVKDGQVWHVFQWPNGTYEEGCRGGSFAPGTPICAVALDLKRVDIFGVGTSGDVEWCFWAEGEPWSQWRSLGSPNGQPLPPGTPVTAVAQTGVGIDVFVVAGDEAVYTSAWRPDSGWSSDAAGWTSLGGDFPPDSAVSAVSQACNSIDLVAVDWRGRPVGASYSDAGWSTDRCGGWTLLGEWFPPGSPVAAAGGNGTVELLAVGADRGCRTLSWLGTSDCASPPGLSTGTYVFDTAPSAARLAGPSRVKLRAPPGRMRLTAEGVLGALDGATIVEGTAIEIPWRLFVSPRGSSGPAVCGHLAAPRDPPSDNAGLWRTRISAAGAGRPAGGAGLVLDVVGVDPDDAGLEGIPLDGSTRASIAAHARGEVPGEPAAPPEADRLELSALGGWLAAGHAWSALQWGHVAALGRDQLVRTQRKGVLYPLGHRAEYVEVHQRVIDPRAPATWATLRTTRTLTVTEPVRGPAADPSLRRHFPFAEVEIERRVFADLGAPDWSHVKRPDGALLALIAELNEARAESGRLDAQIRPALERRLTFDELLAAGDPSAQELRRIWDLMAAVEAEIARILHYDAEASTAAEHERLRALGYEAEVAQLAVDAAGAPPADVFALAQSGLPEAGVAQQLIDLQNWIAAKEQEERDLRDALASPLALFFRPRTPAGALHQFPLRCRNGTGEVRFGLPLIFVSDEAGPPSFANHPDAAAMLEAAWAGTATVAMGGTPIDLVHDAPDHGAEVLPGDVHEVHQMSIGASGADGFRPRLDGFLVGLPAARELVGGDVGGPRPASFDLDYLTGGETGVALRLASPVELPFTGRAERSGALVAPTFSADAISRGKGLVKAAALVADPSAPPPFEGDSTLLGFSLAEVLGPMQEPPEMTSRLIPGRPPAVRLQWGTEARPLSLKSRPPLEAPSGRFILTVERSPERTITTCAIRDFALLFPTTGASILRLKFGALEFVAEPDRKPDLKVEGIDLEFLGDLQLLDGLRRAANLAGTGPSIEVTASRIVAGYSIHIPETPAGGIFSLRNIALHAAIVVPFGGDPVSVELGFARPDDRFNLSVLLFGGGGHVVVEVDHTGVKKIDAAIEFGAAVSMNFFVAHGEVHALGGASYRREPDGTVEFSAFVRFGGSVKVLGLVSVSIEMVVTLGYRPPPQDLLVGRAKLVIEIDLTLFSDSVELDTGDWVLLGEGDTDARADAGSRLDAWRAYRGAFAA